MRAILSDIHGNLEALEAVLRDAQEQGAKEIFCLGDIVGYGPSPLECLELAQSWDLTLLGNHDYAVLHEPEGFGPGAERAILWTREFLDASPRGKRCLSFLGSLSPSWAQGEVTYVHASPRNPLHEYIFPECVYNEKKMEELSDTMSVPHCFCGHTHVAGVHVRPPADKWAYYRPSDLEHVYHLNSDRAIINVGSVGQPRDGNSLAGYVLFDGEAVRFRRVEYDINRAAEKVFSNPRIDRFQGERLFEGR